MKNNFFKKDIVLIYLFFPGIVCFQTVISQWPDSSNTGLTNPEILTASDGFTVTVDSTIIENLEINGTLMIDANKVTVRNCRIWPGNFYGILVNYDRIEILIEDCEIGDAFDVTRRSTSKLSERDHVSR